MRHEAASVDPETHIAYLTEDRPDGCFYRFVPRDRDKPFEGTLQALRVRDHAAYDSAQMHERTRVAIDWVDIDHPDSPDDDVRFRAQAKGAARVCRGEGLWLGQGEAFFCATAGGRLGAARSSGCDTARRRRSRSWPRARTWTRSTCPTTYAFRRTASCTWPKTAPAVTFCVASRSTVACCRSRATR